MAKQNIMIGTIVGLFILICIFNAIVAIAVMQVVRTVEEIGPGIYIVGGAIFLSDILFAFMLIFMISRLKNIL